jgi:hypothetical protein
MTTASSIRLVATPPQARHSSGLRPIDFDDCYHGFTSRKGLTAIEVARAALADPPAWAEGLMSARNAIVGVFGLKTPSSLADGGPRVGIFPLLSESPTELVLGLDDKHLDFRIWLSLQETPEGTNVWMSTLIRHNGWSGRAYLFAIMPFHVVLSRMMLGRGLRAVEGGTTVR